MRKSESGQVNYPKTWPLGLQHSFKSASPPPAIYGSGLAQAHWHAGKRTRVLSRAAADALHLPVGAPPERTTWLTSQTLLPGFTSQFGQDSTIYYNFFAGRLAAGAPPGFFVDIGANNPKELSNTYFLEKCMGWKGICIEADPGLAAVLRAERACTVVNLCADSVRKDVPFVMAGSSGHVASSNKEDGAVMIPCAPLASVLKEHGVGHVDFLTIDIEGNELSALIGYEWDAIPIEMLLIESAWSSEMLDMLLSDAGMWRVSDIGYLDDLYMRRAPLLMVPRAFRGRQQNWEFLRGIEKNRKKSFKRDW